MGEVKDVSFIHSVHKVVHRLGIYVHIHDHYRTAHMTARELKDRVGSTAHRIPNSGAVNIRTAQL